MLGDKLQSLGFGKNEVKVYLALFELGKAKAGNIITATGLHRNLVYTALEELIRKDLVAKVLKNKVSVYQINSPESLQELFESQVQTAKEVVEELKDKVSEKPRDIKIFEGTEGVKRSRSQVLNYDAGETLYVIGTQASSSTEMEKYWRSFHRQRSQKGINLKIMYEHGVEPENLEWRNKLPLSKAKYLPMNFHLPVWFAFIKDYVEIGVVSDNPLVFSIRSEEAAEAFKNFFQFFWNQHVVVESGVEALKNNIYNMLDSLEAGEEYYVLGASAGDYKNDINNLYDQFHRDRINKGVGTKMLVYKESFDQIKDRFVRCGDREGKISQVKSFLSAPPTPMQINLYKNKAYFIFYGDEPTVFRFEQPGIYDGFKAYFDTLWEQTSYFLRGPEVVRDTWIEASEKYKEFKFIGARGYFVDRYPEMFAEVKKRVENIPGLKWKNIVDPSARDHEINNLPWMEARYNAAGSKNPNVVWLYGNKVAVANWTETEPVVFISEDKNVVDSYRDYFDELWNKEVIVDTGMDALRRVYYDMLDELKSGEEYYIFGTSTGHVPHLEEFFENYHTERIKRGVVLNMLAFSDYYETARERNKRSGDPEEKISHVKKYIASPLSRMQITLFNNKARLIIFGEDPVVIYLDKPEIYLGFKTQFDVLWKKSV